MSELKKDESEKSKSPGVVSRFADKCVEIWHKIRPRPHNIFTRITISIGALTLAPSLLDLIFALATIFLGTEERQVPLSNPWPRAF